MTHQHSSSDWTSKLSRDQLCAELIKCHEERERLWATCNGDNNNNNYDRNNSINDTRHNSESDGQTDYAQLVSKLRDERDAVRNELASLQREMDELHDNFKEEENEQFEQLKQELDSAVKNCKILQIKLNKSERQYNQLEQVKLMLERQLEDQMIQQTAPKATSTTIEPYGNTLTNRLNKTNSNDSSSCDNPNNNSSANFIQLGSQCIKLATHEYDQLLRDLNDTIEREKDLAEQLKYSQEDAQVKSDRLQIVESENESLLANIQKLTQSNAQLRSQQMTKSRSPEEQQNSGAANDNNLLIIEQNEQLKLALDLSQSECKQFKSKCKNLASCLEQKEQQLKEAELRRSKLESDLTRVKSLRRSTAIDHADQQAQNGSGNNNSVLDLEDQVSRLELECRQLRSKLVHSERDNKQLKQNTSKTPTPAPSSKLEQELAQLRETNRQLTEQLSNSKNHSESSSRNESSTNKSDSAIAAATANQEASDELLARMRIQLDATENELAKTKSRLVELDLELNKTRRAYKGLLESLEGRAENSLASKAQGKDQSHLRDAMTRQELRDNIRDLESQVEELKSLLRASAHLLKQQQHDVEATNKLGDNHEDLTDGDEGQGEGEAEQMLKLEREANVKMRTRLNELERSRVRQERELTMLQRERVKMQEELDRLRNLNTEIRNELEESSRREQQTKSRQRDLQLALDKLRKELGAQQQRHRGNPTQKLPNALGAPANSEDPNVLAKDLSELKVKNNFLMRELELARDDYQRQLEDERKQREQQIKRAVELAQLEIREVELASSGKLREEISDLKSKLAANQRLVTRTQEDAELERDKLRGAEREWRRERSQWQQKVEQLDSQLTIERRASGFKLKEFESSLRDKDRELLSYQDKCLQLERDLTRVQGKYSQYQEQCENKISMLNTELDLKKRDIQSVLQEARNREEENYESIKRLSSEKACLSEALESIKCTLDEKMGELKSARELLVLRQDQNYRERQANQEKLDELSRRLVRVNEWESQCKLLQNQCQINEKQGESLKRELLALKENKQRLKTRCDELERRCLLFEKQELMAKTSALSKNNHPISSIKIQQSVFSQKPSLSKFANNDDRTKDTDNADPATTETEMNERLLAKVNDQRNLMGIMKQQIAELQIELKQAKLLHSCEKSKLQCQIIELTSRLNESEEKLLVELSLNNVPQQTLEAGKRKIEIRWLDERKSANELIGQQQAENDKLTRDLKKLSQAHDLLRLHCKQTESHNAKLSRKLIEYQQKDSHQNASSSSPQHLRGNSAELIAKLEDENARLSNLLRDQVQPLVETVSRMMKTIESTNQPSGSTTTTPSAADSQQKSTQSSTLRPLRTTPINNNSRESSVDESDNCSQAYNPPQYSSITARPDQIQIRTAKPAHQMNATYQQSRLSRFLPTSKSNLDGQESTNNSNDNKTHADSSAKRNPTTKTVRKVRLKSASLGLTLAERRQLKTRLEQLSSELVGLESGKINTTIRSSSNNRTNTNSQNPADLGSKYNFNLDSDLDSSSQTQYKPIVIPKLRLYQADKRLDFDDKHSSSDRHQFEADYESESSIRSDYSTASAAPAYRESVIANRSSFGGHRSSISAGAESDSALTTTSGAGHLTGGSSTDQLASKFKVLTKTKPSRGLKGRLTNKIRSLSRSFVGLTSDSEGENQQDQLDKDQKRFGQKDKANKRNSLYGYEQQQSFANPSASSNDIREVRL